MYSIMVVLIKGQQDDIKSHVPVVCIQNMPQSFDTFYRDSDFMALFDAKIIKNDCNLQEIKNDILEGSTDLLVVFNENFDEDIKNYKKLGEVPDVKVYFNPEEDYSFDAKNRIVLPMLSEFESYILGQRLGNIEYVNAFDIDRDKESSIIIDPEKSSSKALSMLLPMLIGIFLFSGAMGIGMDSITGEKERGTMATLLVTPTKREHIALGKLISLGIIAKISACLLFIGVIASFPLAAPMFNENMSIISGFSFSFTQYLYLIIILISLVAIYVGLICLLSVIAKNMKEAGSYIVPIYMIVMIASIANGFMQDTPQIYQYMIPIYGQLVALKSLFSFELTFTAIIGMSISTILVTILLVKLITMMFNNEKVMFSS